MTTTTEIMQNTNLLHAMKTAFEHIKTKEGDFITDLDSFMVQRNERGFCATTRYTDGSVRVESYTLPAANTARCREGDVPGRPPDRHYQVAA